MDTQFRHAIIERDGVEICAVKKAQEKKLDVAEMRMLRWMSGVTKLDRMWNEVVWACTEKRRIMCSKSVMVIDVPGAIMRGRPKRMARRFHIYSLN